MPDITNDSALTLLGSLNLACPRLFSLHLDAARALRLVPLLHYLPNLQYLKLENMEPGSLVQLSRATMVRQGWVWFLSIMSVQCGGL